MNDKRPINLDLTTVRFPVTAIASILHRVCGMISWVGLGLLLVLLSYALPSQEQFAELESLFHVNFLVQFLGWGFLTAFGYYCLATLKHIVQDFGLFEDFEGGKMVSWTAIIIGIILSILAGVFVWV